MVVKTPKKISGRRAINNPTLNKMIRTVENKKKGGNRKNEQKNEILERFLPDGANKIHI